MKKREQGCPISGAGSCIECGCFHPVRGSKERACKAPDSEYIAVFGTEEDPDYTDYFNPETGRPWD